MTGSAERGARAELDAARGAVARLDANRSAEDVAADLIETWSAVEAALRSLAGTTTLTGLSLIRETRQRQIIGFDLANTLAEFLATRDRVHDTAYLPTQADVNVARDAYLKLDAAIISHGATPPHRPNEAHADARGAETEVIATPWIPPADSSAIKTVKPPRRFPAWALLTVGVVVLGAALSAGGYFAFRGRGNGSLQQGVDAYRSGQREVAVSAFGKAAREDPHAALPNVYLARMAREVGNATLASEELQLALQAEPSNAIALREMGANLLAQGNYELARRFYVRAVEADPADKSSQGYLGCVLQRLNRPTEAASFFNRAGAGPWTNCAAPSQTPP